MTTRTLSHTPVNGITVRMQRTETNAFVVTVERTFAVDELRRSFAEEAPARRYARSVCLALIDGWTIDRLIEMAGLWHETLTR